jgi:hypothetical protein
MIKTPKMYLVSRVGAGMKEVQEMLALTPIAGAICASPEDAVAAEPLTEVKIGNGGPPLAIVAQFEHPLSVVNEDGTVETLWPAPAPYSK